jgi:hypothetical protein
MRPFSVFFNLGSELKPLPCNGNYFVIFCSKINKNGNAKHGVYPRRDPQKIKCQLSTSCVQRFIKIHFDSSVTKDHQTKKTTFKSKCDLDLDLKA